MNGFAPADALQPYRPLLLAMEAVGWLHMVGKASTAFLEQHGGRATNYEYQNPSFNWDNLLGWAKSNFGGIGGIQAGWPRTLAEFSTEHAKSGGTGLIGLLQAAHGITSGIEKNLPASTSRYLEQDATHMWLSSAFGYPQRNLLSDPPELLATQGWNRLIEEIYRILADLKRLGEASAVDVGAWWGWRESAIGPESLLRKAFSSTLAETRLPNNDVTLWDQSYVAAALFKSAVAGAILEDRFPWDDKQIKQTTRWRLLTVGIGADHYEARSVRINDWVGARQTIDEFFGKVRRLIEVELAVGSLLYTDGTTSIFSFPGERSKVGSQVKAPDGEQWRRRLQGQIDAIAKGLALETPPSCGLSDSTRSLVPMVKEMRETRKALAVPLHRPWKISSEAADGHVCPVCLVRQNGNGKDKQAPCKVCWQRRRGRLDAWLDGKLGSDTIWLNELADANDRVALLTLSLDIEPWLGSDAVDSLHTQSIATWRMFNPLLGNIANPIDPSAPFEKLTAYVKSKLPSFDKGDAVLSSLQEGYKFEPDWKPFFDKIVEDRSDAPLWDNLNDNQRARWLVHQLFCKLPSPGRVYRFWRQAEEFFDDLLRKFRGIAAQDANRWRTRRLILKPHDAIAGVAWRDREVYDGRWRDEPISLLYDSTKNSFITACNLARLLRADDSKESLRNVQLSVKAEDDNNKECEFKVADVRDDVGSLGVYHPIVPLEISPLRFRVLVPLEAASACVDLAVEAWEREFARAWDRLPLRVGIVAFPQKLPFQAVIETARNIEESLESSRSKPWRVVERDIRDGVVALNFQRPDGGRELRTMPLRLPDGRADVFYPYLAVEDRSVRFPHDFQHPRGQVYRHASDLRPGDGIHVSLAGIAALFMDSAIKRFDKVQPRPLSEWRRMRETWQLLDRVAPSTSALRGAWNTLAERQTAWRSPGGDWLAGGKPAWTDLARAVLKDALSVEGAVLDALVEAAADAVLERAIEWHLSVLKKRLGEVGDGR
ncbi:MAG: CRISPR-associated protein Csx11 [Candidatus Binataceae bacterium]|nr:CRISPR-associated protein Csx11 [Candidatus Binataceae bacterium]